MRQEYFLRKSAFIEIAIVLALIYFYIWILMPLHNYGIDVSAHLFIFITVCLLQVLRRLPLRMQGVRFDNLMRALKPAGLVTLVLFSSLILLGFLWGKLTFRTEILLRSWWFLPWGPIQQFLLQSLLHLRVRSIINSDLGGILLSALIFSLVHLPNYYLMLFSFVGALCWCYLFARNPNIFALGLSHAILDLALAVFFPAELLGNLKVGPGFLSE